MIKGGLLVLWACFSTLSLSIYALDAEDPCFFRKFATHPLSPDVVEAFRLTIPRVTIHELVDLAESTNERPPIPEHVFEELKEAHRVTNRKDIFQIWEIVSQFKFEGKQLDLEKIERVTIHIASKLSPQSPRFIVKFDAFENTDLENRPKPRRPSHREILKLARSLIPFAEEVALGKPNQESADAVESLIHQLVEILPRTAVMNHEHEQEFTLKHYLLAETRSQEVTDRILEWIKSGLLEYLESSYTGHDGMLHLASEMHSNNVFVVWIWARRYLSAEILKNTLGWNLVNFKSAATAPLFSLIEKWKEDPNLFLKTYSGERGLQRARSDYYGDADALDIHSAFKFVLGERVSELCWSQHDKPKYIAQEMQSLFDSDEFKIRPTRTRNKTIRAIALRFIGEDLDSPPTTEEIETHLAHIHQLFQYSKALMKRLPPEFKFHASVSSDLLLAEFTESELLETYFGPRGLINLSSEFGVPWRSLFSSAKKRFGGNFLKKLEWRLSRIPASRAGHIRQEVLPNGLPSQEFRSSQGLYGLQILNPSYPAAHLLALFTEAEKAQLNWNTGRLENIRATDWDWYIRYKTDTEIFSTRIFRMQNDFEMTVPRIYSGGKPKPIFQGPEGKLLYLALYYYSNGEEFEMAMRRLLNPKQIKELGWEDPIKTKSEILRLNAARKRWLPLVLHDGKLDPFFKGKKGLQNLMRYRQSTEDEAREYAREILSPVEFLGLNWD